MPYITDSRIPYLDKVRTGSLRTKRIGISVPKVIQEVIFLLCRPVLMTASGESGNLTHDWAIDGPFYWILSV